MQCGNMVFVLKILPLVTFNTATSADGAPWLICAGTALSVEAFPTPVWPHLSDGTQQLPIAEHDHQEWHDEAEDKQADDVGYAICRLCRPVDRAGRPRALWAVAAPAKEWWQGPDEGVDPGQGDAQRDLTVVGRICLGGCHHCAVAFIGEDGEGDEGHNSWGLKGRHIHNHCMQCKKPRKTECGHMELNTIHKLT